MVLMNLFAGQGSSGDTDIETYGHWMGGGEGGTNGKSSMETCTTICKLNVKVKVT